MGVVTLQKIVKNSSRLDKVLAGVVLFGLVVAVTSFFRGIVVDRQVQVEYLSEGNDENSTSTTTIFVDIAGAVQNSGVYELAEDSRVIDVLSMAGGLSENADREYCEKNINLAEPLKDGQKIYIPEVNNTDAPMGYVEAKNGSNKVCINTATVQELDTLWGIGEARAESIVKNRPYQSVEDLISKGVLTKNLVDKNRELLTVY